MNDLCFLDRDRAPRADPLPPRLRDRGAAGAPGADRAREPEGERDRHAPAGRGARRGARRRRRARPRRGGRPALRACPSPTRTSCRPAASAPRAGSPIYKDHVPEHDGLIVERIKAAGAITIGKTNTPEFGAGSQTFNEVFGRTLNPYDPSKTCGGSSGGAAVALASRLVPIADGSDLGGSLRNPASFCNVVGFRPSPGRVPTWPSELGWVAVFRRGADGAHGGGRGAAALGAWRGPIRARPSPSTSPARAFAARSTAASPACGSRGAGTSAACPSTRA